MSFIPVLEYIAGIFAFAFVYLICDDIILSIDVVVGETYVYDLGMYIWTALAIIYTIGGAFWLWKQYTAPKYYQGW